jgi:sec-independent protein translocase protein TatC
MGKITKDDEAEIEASKAPLLDHLVELRTRLIRSLISLFVAFILCFFFAEQIYAVLVRPLYNAYAHAGRTDPRMIFTAPQEAFLTYVKLGVFGGLCIAFPVMAHQIWGFIAPGLYRHERKAFWPFLLMTPVMFIAGAAFVYYILLPNAMGFFLGFETQAAEGVLPIQLEARVSEYLSLVMTLILAFGFCFELPVLLVLLGMVGIVTSSQVSLMVPLILLYESSIWIVWFLERGRAKQEAQSTAVQTIKP